MKPALAKFTRLDKKDHGVQPALEVQFNPTEYTLNKGNQIAEVPIPGLDSPILQFVRGQTETLTMDLFFDSTDEGGLGSNAKSVTIRTDEFYKLIKIESDTHAPPILLVSWGGGPFPGTDSKRIRFKCVVESVRQRYTLFSDEGVPLRATLTVTLKEYKTLTQQLKELGLLSADHTKAHVVQEGDTLSDIAFQSYGDPAAWRVVATENRIDDPLELEVGAILLLPPLT
jgi:hypothetical protein